MNNSATVGIIIPQEFLGREELTWPYDERYGISPGIGGISVYVENDENLAKFLYRAFPENDDEMWNEELLPYIMEGDRFNYQKSYRALRGKAEPFSRVKPKQFSVKAYEGGYRTGTDTGLKPGNDKLKDLFGNFGNFEDIVYLYDANRLKWYVSDIYYNRGQIVPLKQALTNGWLNHDFDEDEYEEDENIDDENYYIPPYNTHIKL
jgi:hypothetical protein